MLAREFVLLGVFYFIFSLFLVMLTQASYNELRNSWMRRDNSKEIIVLRNLLLDMKRAGLL